MSKRNKDTVKPATAGAASPLIAPHVSTADRLAAGGALRDKVQRGLHGAWKRGKGEVDPLAILRASDKGRVARLLPIRYGRMLQTPFTFYRGSAAVMAADLAKTPVTGIHVQACGDCHLMNFGGFATPERNVLFDINDFDETLPAPWEWDLKRLVASFVLAARNNGLSDAAGRDAAVACAASYRERLREYAEMSPLDVWYARITHRDLIETVPDKKVKARIQARVDKSTSTSGSDLEYPEIAEMVGGQIRIRDNPPLIYHPDEMSPDELRTLARGQSARLSGDPDRGSASAARPVSLRGRGNQGRGDRQRRNGVPRHIDDVGAEQAAVPAIQGS